MYHWALFRLLYHVGPCHASCFFMPSLAPDVSCKLLTCHVALMCECSGILCVQMWHAIQSCCMGPPPAWVIVHQLTCHMGSLGPLNLPAVDSVRSMGYTNLPHPMGGERQQKLGEVGAAQGLQWQQKLKRAVVPGAGATVQPLRGYTKHAGCQVDSPAIENRLRAPYVCPQCMPSWKHRIDSKWKHTCERLSYQSPKPIEFPLCNKRTKLLLRNWNLAIILKKITWNRVASDLGIRNPSYNFQGDWFIWIIFLTWNTFIASSNSNKLAGKLLSSRTPPSAKRLCWWHCKLERTLVISWTARCTNKTDLKVFMFYLIWSVFGGISLPDIPIVLEGIIKKKNQAFLMIGIKNMSGLALFSLMGSCWFMVGTSDPKSFHTNEVSN